MDRDSAESLRRARRTAALVGLAITGLAGAKIGVGKVAGSTALVADGIHSIADLVAVGASWFGLKMAARPPTDRFPFGYHRAESVAALFVSLLILVMGGEIFHEGMSRLGSIPEPAEGWLALGTALVSSVAACLLFVWQRSAARRSGSQSLSVTAEEMRVDILTSLLVLVALVASSRGIPYIEGGATMLIAGFVCLIGLKNTWIALLSLMDATVDPDLEKKARRILEAMPGVKDVEKLRARKAGPIYFLEGHVRVPPSMDVTKTHLLCHDAQERIRQELPQVETVLLHVEPFSGSLVRILVPVEGTDGLDEKVSRQFSRAPFFVRAVLEGDEILASRVQSNPFLDRKIHAGLAVFHELIEAEGTDVIMVQQIGEIVYHVVRDHGIETYKVPRGVSAREAIALYRQGKLTRLHGPTRSAIESHAARDRSL